jgi:hypothetical protein
LPPSGFFTDARDTKVVTLFFLVLPGTQNRVGNFQFNLKQFFPPDGSDEHPITGPSYNVALSLSLWDVLFPAAASAEEPVPAAGRGRR